MKLEIKHLAPYLPYGLKWYHKRMDSEPTELLTMTTLQLESDGNVDVMFEEEWISDIVHKITIEGFPTWVKPILRPLSDLMQPEHITNIGYRSLSRNGGESYTLSQYEYLFKNHFDVFGLIPAELAIDINELNKTEV